MKQITTHLWFDKEAKEAAAFYTSLFPNSKIENTSKITGTPSGDCDIVNFTLADIPFMAISAGPYFKFNPSISFLVVCKTREEVNNLWAKLSTGGKILMPLEKYPFSEWYGWAADKYGLTWQIILDDGHYPYRHKITPTLMFVGDVCGRAAEAMNFYASILPEGKVGDMVRYPAGMEPDKEGTVMHGAVSLAGREFFAMDSAQKHDFAFNEAISFIVNCDTQEEIDYYWGKLSAVPELEQCGWLKDKFGVSWQIVPTAMNKMMASGDQAKIDKLTKAFLPMKKLDIKALQEAFNK